MNSINFAAEKKHDFSFIASLIIIIIVALYFGVDLFKKSNLSEYLEKTGNELFAKIVDNNERTSLQESYAKILKKIENKEISPAKVEHLTANLINLKMAQEYLNPEELRAVLLATFNKAGLKDSLNIMVEPIDNEKWIELNDRVHNIERFEHGIIKAQLADRAENSSGVFEYAVDDSLHIIVDDRFKGELVVPQPSEYANEIIVLEQERLLKWSKDLEKQLSREREEIKKNIAILKLKENNLNISTSVSSNLSDALIITTNNLDSVIELQFNFSTPAEVSDSIIYTIPETPEVPDSPRD